eukprot:Gb_20681 [translate_table: standard]
MAVQAQFPSNVLLPDFRTRNGQASDHRNLLGIGFGSAALMEEYPAVGVPIQARLFNAVPNAAHGQQVPSTTNSVVFHSPEEPACNVKRPREPADLLSLKCKRPSLMNLADLNQQAPGTVSTGLRLAFEDERANASAPNAARGDSGSPFSLISEDLMTKSQQQRDEIDQFLRVQGEHLRQSLAEKRQMHLRSLLAVIEEGVSRRLREKDLEMEKVNRRNMELEERVKQLKLEAHVWQSKARNHEAMVVTLRNNLQQAVAQSREQSKEGCGDSEAADAESAHLDPNAEIPHPKPLRGTKDPRDQITCKVCRKNVVSILLLPCRHLCLCRDCEITVDTCPLCYAMKNASVEVYMS